MDKPVKCPVCLNAAGGKAVQFEFSTNPQNVAFECDVCGRFELSGSVYAGVLNPQNTLLTPLQRVVLSHRICSAGWETKRLPIVTSPWFDEIAKNSVLPTPATQALNAVRYIGQYIQETGGKIPHLQPKITAIMGSRSAMLAGDLLIELKDRGLIDGVHMKNIAYPPDVAQANLTLAGWEQFEAEAKGKISGKYGFLALAFGKPDLDPFVNSILKPEVKKQIGYELVDMRDVAAAGVIDNIMRAKIRDAAFVLVDLTHDNFGAYWEAGYAEGLGKPVIYICEKAKFAEKSTHFDTNHCTTVPWTQEEPTHFINELVATLRRSLNLFE